MNLKCLFTGHKPEMVNNHPLIEYKFAIGTVADLVEGNEKINVYRQIFVCKRCEKLFTKTSYKME